MMHHSGKFLLRERECVSTRSAVVPRLADFAQKLRRPQTGSPPKPLGVGGTGGPSTPRLIGSSPAVSGILDRPVKPGDDTE